MSWLKELDPFNKHSKAAAVTRAIDPSQLFAGDPCHITGQNAEMESPELYASALQLAGSTTACALPPGSYRANTKAYRNSMAGMTHDGERWLYVELQRKEHHRAWMRNLVWWRPGTRFSNQDGRLVVEG